MISSENLIKELSDQKFALDQSAIVAATDRNGRITYANSKFCEISGYSESELLGQNHRILNSGFHSHDFFIDMWKCISSGKVWRGEICNLSKSGHVYWVDTTIVPFLGEDQRPYQYLSIRHEITALKNAESTILEQQARLVAASKLSALGEVSAAISHEINNPLGVILGRSEMLRGMIESEKIDLEMVKKNVAMIEKTARRIETIVTSMRNFTRENDSESLRPVKISEIIGGAMDLVTQRFIDHGIKFDLVSYDRELKIVCNSTQIMQIIMNLLNNAHDAVLSLPAKWVRLEIKNSDGNIFFIVTDSGPGIKSEVQQKLFTPFFTTKDVQYGTGLGLSISKILSAKNKGTLEYDAKSANTRFVLRLPLVEDTIFKMPVVSSDNISYENRAH